MVKLATARDCRTYGPGASRNRSEYINAGLYLFSTIVLLCGFAAELSREPKSGLVLLVIALVLVAVVNIHDLVAHLAGIDYRICLFAYDPQLALIEFAAPLMHVLGCVCSFLGILFLFIKAEKGSDQFMELEKHGLNLLIAGPALWLLGSILNSCQIYERAGGHVQILQQSVHIPFLMASLLLLVGAILNYNDTQTHHHQHVAHHSRFKSLLGGKWVWLGICGSLLLFAGGLANVVKVFKMQQMDGEMSLKKLRGGAQDRLVRERDGRGMPLISGDFPPLIADDGCRWRRDRQPVEEGQQAATTTPTPYKDVLVSDV